MNKLLNEEGVLPYEYYQKTLSELTDQEWQSFPPEVKLAQLFADYGTLSDNHKYYEFYLWENSPMINKLSECAEQLNVQLHSSATGIIYAVERLKDVDEILEYFC